MLVRLNGFRFFISCKTITKSTDMLHLCAHFVCAFNLLWSKMILRSMCFISKYNACCIFLKWYKRRLFSWHFPCRAASHWLSEKIMSVNGISSTWCHNCSLFHQCPDMLAFLPKFCIWVISMMMCHSIYERLQFIRFRRTYVIIQPNGYLVADMCT